MDLVGFDRQKFEQIRDAFVAFAASFPAMTFPAMTFPAMTFPPMTSSPFRPRRC